MKKIKRVWIEWDGVLAFSMVAWKLETRGIFFPTISAMRAHRQIYDSPVLLLPCMIQHLASPLGPRPNIIRYLMVTFDSKDSGLAGSREKFKNPKRLSSLIVIVSGTLLHFFRNLISDK